MSSQRSQIAWCLAVLCMSLAVGCSPPPPPGDETPDAGHEEPARDASTPLGPLARISPASVVDFGQVAFFAGRASQEPTLRKVVVFNLGDAPLQVEPTLEPGSNPPASDELELLLPDGWSPDQAIGTHAGSNSVELTLRLTPKSLGQRVWHLRVHTNDPQHAETELEVRANIMAPPTCQYSVTPPNFKISLGLLSPPDYRDLPIRISNTGITQVQQCLVSDLELDAPDGSPISLPGGKITDRVIRAGESLEVMLRIAGVTARPPADYEAQLRFHIAPTDGAEVVVPISVSLAENAACATIAPNALDFGTVSHGCGSATRTFNVYNTCSEPMTIHAFSISGPTLAPGAPGCPGSDPCPAFKFVQTPAIPSGGLTVSPGSSNVTFQVKFKPVASGPATGSVTITASDSSGMKSYVVDLSGTGDPPVTQVDTFYQDPLPKTDLLFVIDNSPSMAGQQASLASNFAALIQYVENAGVDFHIAVTTADSSLGAAFLSGPSDPDTVLTPSSTNLDAQFAAKVNVGTSGSGNPQCLEQALNALTSPLITSQNAGFLRSDAPLSVICVTDSTDHSPRAVSDYVSDLQAIKAGDLNHYFFFNAVGGFTQACPGDVGGRLADAVSLTHGITAEVCDPNWESTFEATGKAAFGFRSNFLLTWFPDLSVSNLEVTVDGQPVASTDAAGATVWIYDAVGNSLNFEPAYVPGPGQTITVTYSVACFP